MPDINAQTGEPQSASGWSTDGGDDASAKGAAALGNESPLAKQFLGRIDKYAGDAEKTFAKQQEAEAPYRENLLKILNSPQAAEAHLEKVKEAPKPEDYQKFSLEFASGMALLGAFSGKWTRNAGNASLNAFAGALKGWQSGNQDAYENAAKEWQQNTQKTLDNNRAELEKYRQIIENKKLTIDQQMAALNLVSSEFQNKIMFDLTMTKNVTGAFTQFDKLEMAGDRVQRAKDKLKEQQDNQYAEVKDAVQRYIDHPDYLAQMPLKDYDKLARQLGVQRQYHPDLPELPPHPDTFPGLAGRATPQNVNSIAEGISTGKQPPILTGLYGMSGPVRAKLEQDGFNLATAQIEWQRAVKQVQTLNGPQMTRFVGLAKSVDKTIDEVRDLSRQMKQSGIPALNKLELDALIQARGNSPEGQLAARYIGAVNTLKEEFANLANGGYAPTEPAWRLANQQINANYGVQELGASLTEIQRLINYRVQGIPGLSTLGAGAPNRYTGGGENAGAPPPQTETDPLGIR